MGEVYRARDTRLGRDVAIKILSSGLSLDHERLARFEQEARAAAALNHPNITALYDVGTHAETPYLVTEMLEGATLRDRLSEGPVPIRKALDYARQVALGLAAAHEKGIVHRDLKPENIFITSDDRAKILDFGLAKLTESEPAVAAATMLPTTPRATVPGMVMGTAGYMAPEQVRGLPVDYRVDVFAFGAVLYEMLTGQRAFRGDTQMDVMMAVAREEAVSLAAIRPDVSPTLARIVERCLEKDPSHRFQSTRDLAFALDGQGSTQSGGTSALNTPADLRRYEPRVTRSRWPWLFGGLVLGAATAGIVVAYRTPAGDVRPQPLTLTLPSTAPAFRLPGVFSARPWYWSPSPDSRWLLGIELKPDGRTQLVLNELATGASRGIDSTVGSVSVINSAWSPDSKMVAYWDATDGFLKRLATDTGAVTRLIQFRDVRAVEWGPDGIIIHDLPGNGGPVLQMVPPTGGAAREVGKLLRNPVVLPDGQILAQSIRDSPALVLVDPKTGDQRLIAPDLSPAGYVRGYVLYNLQERLVAQRLDATAGALVGDQIPLGGAASQRVFASDQLLSWVTSGASELTAGMVWIDRAGRRVPVPGDTVGQSGTTLGLFDDLRVAFGRLGPGTNGADVRTLSLDTGATVQIAATPIWEDHPRWSRDGRRLLFRSGDTLKIADVGSNVPPKTVIESIPGLERVDDWSRDARHVLVSASTAERRYDILAVDLQSGGAPVGFATTTATESFARFSPDATMVTYVSDVSGPPEVYVQEFPGAETSQRVSQSGGTVPKWSADGSRIYFLSPDAWIMEAPVSRQRGEISVGVPVRVVPASGQEFMPSSDGQRFLVLESARPRSLALVNWRSLLPEK
jgi:serine/threonine protein kinase/Tol biopolymer transport system component